MIRMQCYRAYGYVQPEKFAEAIEEAEKAETGTPKDIGMLIERHRSMWRWKSMNAVRRYPRN